MQAKELNQLLINSFPELEAKFHEEVDWQDGYETGSFVVFEDVFMPFLEANVEMNNEELIERIYSFIEALCDIDDEYVQNVLYVAILENIADYENSEPFAKYLKENSKKIYLENYNN